MVVGPGQSNKVAANSSKHVRQVSLDEAVGLLQTGFLRGGSSFLKGTGEMIKGGGGTLPREVRIGIAHVSFLNPYVNHTFHIVVTWHETFYSRPGVNKVTNSVVLDYRMI